MVIPWKERVIQLWQNSCSWIWYIDPEWYCENLFIYSEVICICYIDREGKGEGEEGEQKKEQAAEIER